VNGYREALAALEEAGITFRLRKIDHATQDLPAGSELDIWLDPRCFEEADAALGTAGFRHMKAPGHPGHRFYIAFQKGRWLKLDAKAPHTASGSYPAVEKTEGGKPVSRNFVSRARGAVGGRRPAATRRLGPVVAVLGPDGAGKGTLISALQARIPVAVMRAYLGIDKRRERRKRGGDPRSGSSPAWREVAGLVRGAVRTWWIILRVYAAAWRGHIVLCDRHPIEVLAVRPRRSQAGAVTERLLTRLLPRPDAIVLLDAPGEVLYRRKREHSVEVLEQWRRRYAEVFGPMGAVTISTTGPRRLAVDRASEVVWNALAERRGW
jgi:thymidylate kinase